MAGGEARGARILVLIALNGCGGGPEAEDASAERQHQRDGHVQAVACLLPPAGAPCDPTLEATALFADGRERAKIRCVDGHPRGHFAAKGTREEVDGELSVASWERLWRVLDAADSCVQVGGVPLRVTRSGRELSCPVARYSVSTILDDLESVARQGPPTTSRRFVQDEMIAGLRLCSDYDKTCPDPSRCPPFVGDPWNGRTRASALAPASAVPDEADAGTSESGSHGRPKQADVTSAIGAVLPSARKCLAPTAPIVHVAIIFAPDGTVADVHTRENAPRAASASCFEAALRRAHVAPFDGPPYEVGLTLRPP